MLRGRISAHRTAKQQVQSKLNNFLSKKGSSEGPHRQSKLARWLSLRQCHYQLVHVSHHRTARVLLLFVVYTAPCGTWTGFLLVLTERERERESMGWIPVSIPLWLFFNMTAT